jgi:hypothetical protein
MPRIAVATELDTITCYRTDCGILFGVPPLWMANKRRDHSDFTCPNGHPQAFIRKSKEEELKEELARTKRTVDYLRSDNHNLQEQKARLKRSVAAQKGVATRLRNKAIAGQCAFCHETFPNVAEHVQAEHPSEAAEVEEGDES